jgi:hypothetical protein
MVNGTTKTLQPLQKRQGQALVEFAFVSIVLVTILAGTLGLGVMLLRANIGVVAVSSISNTLDQQIDEVEFDNVITLTDALAGNNTTPAYFQEIDLVLTAVEYNEARNDFASSGVSLVIRDLLPLYEFHRFENGEEVYHFPGTIMERVSDNEMIILVPITNSRDSENRQVIDRWVKPVEFEIPVPQTDPPIATVKVNHPVSSGILIAYSDTGEFTQNGDPVRRPVSSEVSPSSAAIPTGYQLKTPGGYGYDSAFAYLTTVRIFQRVLTQSSTFRAKQSEP